MKRKVYMTIPLLIIFAACAYMAVFTYDMVKAKSNLEAPSQVTMVVLAPTATPVPTVTPTPEITPTPIATPIPEIPGSPVLTLVSDTIEVTVGQSFNVISAVADITDDDTDRSTLFRRIRVHGDYNLRVAGEYTLEYIVSDLQRHDSLPKYLKLVVKES